MTSVKAPAVDSVPSPLPPEERTGGPMPPPLSPLDSYFSGGLPQAPRVDAPLKVASFTVIPGRKLYFSLVGEGPFHYAKTESRGPENLDGNDEETVVVEVPAGATCVGTLILNEPYFGDKLALPTSINGRLPEYVYVPESPDLTVKWSVRTAQLFVESDFPLDLSQWPKFQIYRVDSNISLPLASITPDPAQTTPADLAPVTREIFEMAQKLSEQGILTPAESLQYAAEELSQSWYYELTPKNEGSFYADYNAGRMKGLSKLHDPKSINTANCKLANIEFYLAARAYGYNVRPIVGFLGVTRDLTSYVSPLHAWVELDDPDQGIVRLDATPTQGNTKDFGLVNTPPPPIDLAPKREALAGFKEKLSLGKQMGQPSLKDFDPIFFLEEVYPLTNYLEEGMDAAVPILKTDAFHSCEKAFMRATGKPMPLPHRLNLIDTFLPDPGEGQLYFHPNGQHFLTSPRAPGEKIGGVACYPSWYGATAEKAPPAWVSPHPMDLPEELKAIFDQAQAYQNPLYGPLAFTDGEALAYAYVEFNARFKSAADPAALVKTGLEGLRKLFSDGELHEPTLSALNTTFFQAARSYGYGVVLIVGYKKDQRFPRLEKANAYELKESPWAYQVVVQFGLRDFLSEDNFRKGEDVVLSYRLKKEELDQWGLGNSKKALYDLLKRGIFEGDSGYEQLAQVHEALKGTPEMAGTLWAGLDVNSALAKIRTQRRPLPSGHYDLPDLGDFVGGKELKAKSVDGKEGFLEIEGKGEYVLLQDCIELHEGFSIYPLVNRQGRAISLDELAQAKFDLVALPKDMRGIYYSEELDLVLPPSWHQGIYVSDGLQVVRPAWRMDSPAQVNYLQLTWISSLKAQEPYQTKQDEHGNTYYFSHIRVPASAQDHAPVRRLMLLESFRWLSNQTAISLERRRKLVEDAYRTLGEAQISDEWEITDLAIAVYFISEANRLRLEQPTTDFHIGRDCTVADPCLASSPPPLFDPNLLIRRVENLIGSEGPSLIRGGRIEELKKIPPDLRAILLPIWERQGHTELVRAAKALR